MVLATWQEREEFIAAYEAARKPGADSDLKDFLPPADHPLRREVLVELIRIELEQSSQRGQVPSVDSFMTRFPELADDREGLARIAFEEYRQHCLHGNTVRPEDYAQRYGIVTTDWPRPTAREDEAIGPTNGLSSQRRGSIVDAARSFRQLLAEHGTANGSVLQAWRASYGGPAEHADLLFHWHASNPPRAAEVADALATMPEVGHQFAGFELLQELGRGAFGRVFLALQTDLAHRYVVLKVSARAPGEPEVLARLQHTNVVPIYSVHRQGPLQGVCMPYFGGTTLADIDARLGHVQGVPVTGQFLVEALGQRHHPLPTEAGTTPQRGTLLPATGPAGNGALPTSHGHTEATLEMLGGLSYVDAVLWLTARLADGLAHAHERGIVHSDLKPANVLVTDEGQPMLLDFNLAVDTTRHIEGRKAFIGGTLPYMAPEHLESFRGGPARADQRSDLYSLGVILYRLLTRRHPFPQAGGTLSAVLPGMIEQRRTVPAVRRWNRAVTPAIEAIVQHCLQPDPVRRYQSARGLQEDIERHLQNLPLRHAPNPSLLERLAKWKRRHPRLTSTTSIAAVAVVALATIATAAWVSVSDLQADVERLAQQQAVQSAADTWQQFSKDARAAQLDVYARIGERDHLERGLAHCRDALARYHVLDNPQWREQPAVVLLSDDARGQLPLQVADVLLLLAHGTTRLVTDATRQQDAAREALRLNELAETCFVKDAVPRVVWEERSKLQALLGKETEAKDLAGKAQALPLTTAQENYWRGADLFLAARYQQAIERLDQAVRLDPKHFRAWFLLATCHYYAGRYGEAAHIYGTCIALEPNVFWPWNNRGLAYAQLKQPARALADFSKAIELKPDYVDAYMNRGLARQDLKQVREAVDDLTKALALQGAPTRVYFMRAKAWDQLGDKARANQDREEGLRHQPADELSWVTRGWARMANDLPAALADFDKALELNPRSKDALLNKTYVLAERWPTKSAEEKRERTLEAAALYDRLVGFYPDFVRARSERGVMLARLGKRTAALADAQEALKRDTSPAVLYQVACIYALTVKEEPNDRVEAFRLLFLALRQGYGYDFLESDTDLIPIREFPEYKRLVAGARALRGGK
jgi:serine/threonine protein kinase/Tfp pilus assembly protein PilF